MINKKQEGMIMKMSNLRTKRNFLLLQEISHQLVQQETH